MGLAGCVGLLRVVFHTACFALGVLGCGSLVLGVFGLGFVVLLPALCLPGFVGLPSSLPHFHASGVLGHGPPFGVGLVRKIAFPEGCLLFC